MAQQKNNFRQLYIGIALLFIGGIITGLFSFFRETPVKQAISETKLTEVITKVDNISKQKDIDYEKALNFMIETNKAITGLQVTSANNVSAIARLTENEATISADNARIKAYIDIKQNEDAAVRNWLYDKKTNMRYNPIANKDSIGKDSLTKNYVNKLKN